MGAIAFDTHLFVKRLTEAGMPEPQAEVLAANQAELINEKLATKQDLKELELALKRDMKELEVALKRDMKELEVALKIGIAEVKHDLTLKISESQTSTLKWVGGLLIGQAALIVALIKLIP